MKTTAIPHAQQLILALKAAKISRVVISPGSRNAPLTIGLTEDSFFDCYSIVDERCAAHVALGMALQTGKPAAVLCTSGSALLNYYPAVAEAYYSQVPLVVISADRPANKIDIGDGQTIQQSGVYSKHIAADTDLAIVDRLEGQNHLIQQNQEELEEVLRIWTHQSAPVHINIPFEEPLYNTVNEYIFKLPVFKEEGVSPKGKLPEAFIAKWQHSKRKLILLGSSTQPLLDDADIDLLTADPNVLILGEISSQITHPKVITSIDSLIAPIEQDPAKTASLFPEMIVSIGGMVVSKKIKQLLRKSPQAVHYHVGHTRALDTFFCLKGHISTSTKEWSAALPTSSYSSDYQQKALDRFEEIKKKRALYLNDLPWSDFSAFEVIFNHLPQNIDLHLGNSSTIRYAQLCPMDATHRIFANRGTSGIDGCTSTAIGSAMVSQRNTVFITGDLSFFYDSNGLWNQYVPDNFKLIIINNNGGGIFRILPGQKDTPNYDHFFETTHQLDASHLCDMHDWRYHKAQNKEELVHLLPAYLSEEGRPSVLEVCTNRQFNDQALLDYFKFLR